ncbi:hypothetical protein DNTS_011324, partial [Danionella cerebrum]
MGSVIETQALGCDLLLVLWLQLLGKFRSLLQALAVRTEEPALEDVRIDSSETHTVLHPMPWLLCPRAVTVRAAVSSRQHQPSSLIPVLEHTSTSRSPTTASRLRSVSISFSLLLLHWVKVCERRVWNIHWIAEICQKLEISSMRSCVEGSVTTCEGGSAVLNCALGQVIHVHSANYGRTDSSLCASGRPPSEVSRTDCYASNSLTLVSNGCEGTSSCSIVASNSVFSDPCVGTFKYLYISYTCELVLVNTGLISVTSAHGGSDSGGRSCEESVADFRCRSNVICEGDRGFLRCAVGKIQITSASFGRTDRRTCSRGRPDRQLRNTHCASPNALAPVSQSCNGQSSCELSATSAIFTDPCPGTYKYLTVSYYCLPPEIRSVTTCEGGSAVLNCALGQVIHVHSANYGRTDSSLCASGRPPSEVSRTDCYASNSLTLVSNGCDGTSSCTIVASNSVFSDPCGGTFKYLYISYTCECRFLLEMLFPLEEGSVSNLSLCLISQSLESDRPRIFVSALPSLFEAAQ